MRKDDLDSALNLCLVNNKVAESDRQAVLEDFSEFFLYPPSEADITDIEFMEWATRLLPGVSDHRIADSIHDVVKAFDSNDIHPISADSNKVSLRRFCYFLQQDFVGRYQYSSLFNRFMSIWDKDDVYVKSLYHFGKDSKWRNNIKHAIKEVLKYENKPDYAEKTCSGDTLSKVWVSACANNHIKDDMIVGLCHETTLQFGDYSVGDLIDWFVSCLYKLRKNDSYKNCSELSFYEASQELFKEYDSIPYGCGVVPKFPKANGILYWIAVGIFKHGAIEDISKWLDKLFCQYMALASGYEYVILDDVKDWECHICDELSKVEEVTVHKIMNEVYKHCGEDVEGEEAKKEMPNSEALANLLYAHLSQNKNIFQSTIERIMQSFDRHFDQYERKLSDVQLMEWAVRLIPKLIGVERNAIALIDTFIDLNADKVISKDKDKVSFRRFCYFVERQMVSNDVRGLTYEFITLLNRCENDLVPILALRRYVNATEGSVLHSLLKFALKDVLKYENKKVPKEQVYSCVSLDSIFKQSLKENKAEDDGWISCFEDRFDGESLISIDDVIDWFVGLFADISEEAYQNSAETNLPVDSLYVASTSIFNMYDLPVCGGGFVPKSPFKQYALFWMLVQIFEHVKTDERIRWLQCFKKFSDELKDHILIDLDVIKEWEKSYKRCISPSDACTFNKIMAHVYKQCGDVDTAINTKEEAVEDKTNNKKETKKMSKKFDFSGMFSENVGIIKDKSVAITLDGRVCVQRGEEYVRYDVDSNSIINMMSLVIDGDFCFLMPKPTAQVGDIVKKGNLYYQVLEVKDDGELRVVSIKTGNKTKIVKENLLFANSSFNIYYVVIPLFGNNMQQGGMNPLMLMALADGEDSDMNNMLMFSMMMSGSHQNGTNNLLPFMLMSKKGGDMNPLMLMAMMSSGGNMNLFGQQQPSLEEQLRQTREQLKQLQDKIEKE